jgi:4-amino-4-deoxy-L-arabinose transferase-like glycosyltransferase
MLTKFLEKRDSQKAVYFLLGISLAVKILLLLLNRPFNSDGVLYITAAQYFAEGRFAEGLSVYPMPLYSLLIAGAHFLIPNWELAAKCISTVSMVLVTIPLYFLTTHLFNRRIAFWTCLALALAPVPNDWSVDVIRGPIFVFFAVLTVYVAQKALDFPKLKYFLFAALTAGVSFFFRIEGLIIAVFFGLYGVYHIVSSKQYRACILRGYLAWLTALLILMPSIAGIGTYLYDGDVNRIEEIAERAEHIASLNFLENYHILYDQLAELEEKSPSADTNHSMAEVARHFMFMIFAIGEVQVFFKIMFPLFIIPFCIGLVQNRNKNQLFLIGTILFYLFIMYIFYIDRNFLHKRFLFAPVVLAFPWIGAGLEYMFNKLRQSNKSKLYFVAFMALFVLAPGFESVHSLAEEDNVLRKAGNWFQQQDWKQEPTVIMNEPRAAFFAGIRFADSILISEDEHNMHTIEEYALEKNADVIILEISKDEKYIQNISCYELLKVFQGKKRDVYILGHSK